MKTKNIPITLRPLALIFNLLSVGFSLMLSRTFPVRCMHFYSLLIQKTCALEQNSIDAICHANV